MKGFKVKKIITLICRCGNVITKGFPSTEKTTDNIGKCSKCFTIVQKGNKFITI